MNEFEVAADLIRANYVTNENGSKGTGVNVRFESLRDAIAAKIKDAELQLREATKKGEDLCCAYGNLLLAAMEMDKHQSDKHELSSCCLNVTPTPAYKLHMALYDLKKLTEKKEGARVTSELKDES